MYVDYEYRVVLLDIWEVLPITSDNRGFRQHFKVYFRLYVDEKKRSDVDEGEVIMNRQIYKLLKKKHRLAKNKNRWRNNYFSL